MAARLVAACFSCSLVHPQRPVDFATYTPLELWEGTHLFHDPYKYALPALLLPTCISEDCPMLRCSDALPLPSNQQFVAAQLTMMPQFAAFHLLPPSLATSSW